MTGPAGGYDYSRASERSTPRTHRRLVPANHPRSDGAAVVDHGDVTCEPVGRREPSGQHELPLADEPSPRVSSADR
jgi:hypothetical protein